MMSVCKKIAWDVATMSKVINPIAWDTTDITRNNLLYNQLVIFGNIQAPKAAAAYHPSEYVVSWGREEKETMVVNPEHPSISVSPVCDPA